MSSVDVDCHDGDREVASGDSKLDDEDWKDEDLVS